MSDARESPPRGGDEPGRESLLAMLGVLAALTAIVVGLSLGWRAVHGGDDRRGGGSTVAPPREGADPAARAFLGPLAAGAPFDGWRIDAVHPIDRRAGALHLELARDDGPGVEVVVMRFSETAPEPVARTPSLAIYVRSERGSQTSEGAIRASQALADALAARESEGHRPPPLEPMR